MDLRHPKTKQQAKIPASSNRELQQDKEQTAKPTNVSCYINTFICVSLHYADYHRIKGQSPVVKRHSSSHSLDVTFRRCDSASLLTRAKAPIRRGTCRAQGVTLFILGLPVITCISRHLDRWVSSPVAATTSRRACYTKGRGNRTDASSIP